MVNEIKNLRVKIDGLARLTKELKPIKFLDNELEAMSWPKDLAAGNPKEIEEAVDNLYLAKAWLGKILQELDVPTPYKNDGNRKTVEDIEPTADEDKGNNTLVGYNHLNGVFQWSKLNHIEKVDWLRQEIQGLVDTVKSPDFASSFSTRELAIARTNAYNYLCEARFWLGFELQRIRESGK